MNAKRALQTVRAPNEREAEDRAWAVVRSAYQAQEQPVRPRSRVRYALALVVALALCAVGLSPAGATVGRLITRALGIQHAAPALSSLPTNGRLLVSGPTGTWTVAADGSTRRLGTWADASWSPHGRYIAVVGGNRLTAIDPNGVTQWTLARRDISDPRWFSPSGYRIAYLSAGQLRVVAGDGTGDHPLASSVADVAPAWRPGHAYQLVYLTRGGTLVERDGDTGVMFWSRPAQGATHLEWSADGRYLLATSPTAARLYDGRGGLISKLTFHSPAIDTALSPDGRMLALVFGGRREQVAVEDFSARGPALRRVLTGNGISQILWSPDSHWLLISWPAADQWVFDRVNGIPRIAAVSHVDRQFSASSGVNGFPRLVGWCCTAH